MMLADCVGLYTGPISTHVTPRTHNSASNHTANTLRLHPTFLNQVLLSNNGNNIWWGQRNVGAQFRPYSATYFRQVFSIWCYHSVNITKLKLFLFKIVGICRCRALYEYKAAQSDELDILPGDIITLTAKLEGGWWQGELHNKTGIFPASYVEEIG